MDLYMKEDARKILIKLYGNQAASWEISDRTIEIIIKMFQQAGYCTHLMDYVPKPYNPFSNPLKSLAKDAVKRLLKHAADDDINLACMKTTAAAYKNEIMYSGM